MKKQEKKMPDEEDAVGTNVQIVGAPSQELRPEPVKPEEPLIEAETKEAEIEAMTEAKPATGRESERMESSVKVVEKGEGEGDFVWMEKRLNVESRGRSIQSYRLPFGSVEMGLIKDKGFYRLEEIPLTKADEEALQTLIESEEVETAIAEQTTDAGLRSAIKSVLQTRRLPSDPDTMNYYVRKHFSLWATLFPLVNDEKVVEISATSQRSSWITHNDFPELGWIETSVGIDARSIQKIWERFRPRVGERVSDKRVVEALDEGGNYVSIALPANPRESPVLYAKKTRERGERQLPWLINMGELSPLLGAYLWLMMDHGKALVVSGRKREGKTTLLSSLAALIPRTAQIALVDKVREYALPMKSVSEFTTVGDEMALKAAIGAYPDVMIIDPVEQERLAQVSQIPSGAAMGRLVLLSVEAPGLESCVETLKNSGFGSASVSTILFVARVKEAGRWTWRVTQVAEPPLERLERLIVWKKSSPNEPERFEPEDAEGLAERSSGLKSIAASSGWTSQELVGQLEKRAKFLLSEAHSQNFGAAEFARSIAIVRFETGR